MIPTTVDKKNTETFKKCLPAAVSMESRSTANGSFSGAGEGELLPPQYFNEDPDHSHSQAWNGPKSGMGAEVYNTDRWDKHPTYSPRDNTDETLLQLGSFGGNHSDVYTHVRGFPFTLQPARKLRKFGQPEKIDAITNSNGVKGNTWTDKGGYKNGNPAMSANNRVSPHTANDNNRVKYAMDKYAVFKSLCDLSFFEKFFTKVFTGSDGNLKDLVTKKAGNAKKSPGQHLVNVLVFVVVLLTLQFGVKFIIAYQKIANEKAKEEAAAAVAAVAGADTDTAAEGEGEVIFA